MEQELNFGDKVRFHGSNIDNLIIKQSENGEVTMIGRNGVLFKEIPNSSLIKIDDWIPASECINEEVDTCYLVHYENGYIGVDLLCNFVQGVMFERQHHKIFGEITHYMPLPKPPKNKEMKMCSTMNRPKEQCGGPDCGSSLAEYNP